MKIELTVDELQSAVTYWYQSTLQYSSRETKELVLTTKSNANFEFDVLEFRKDEKAKTQ